MGTGVTWAHPVAAWAATHRSWVFCRFSHNSGVVLKARDRRSAMSGVTPARSFAILERCLRDTPRRSARAVTERPKGSIYSR